jgi:hypothetical protein
MENFSGKMEFATDGNSMPLDRARHVNMEPSACSYMNGLSSPGKRHVSALEKE